ncbi:ATP-dependent RNA helicase suv3, mitochondrial [Sparassis crispa]|uniref:ATP-dependent RNA helicase suv3, mitochondrial n=1 Tax=Sparassis crispa TaxID=139825 RepID=A0A401GKY3_9APHY|nr:ATP-dependent RNA helicase suv3, mitochondrial [Sparassis crispa]GBE82827.1 ATP-dependent RNA helicase suv3, mitochondrial [Sparassis crispa]
MADVRSEHPTILIAPDDVAAHFEHMVTAWSKSKMLAQRLYEFGIPQQHIPVLLSIFVKEMSLGNVMSTLLYTHEEVSRIAYDLSHPGTSNMVDIYLTKILYEWATRRVGQVALAKDLPPDTLYKLTQLFEAADLSRPFTWFRYARMSERRKVIMHVGPTNSGKTHNALRALAAARTGLYAGPLRLLAHEIWERLNNGQIVPLGASPEADAEPDPGTNVELGDAPVGGSGPVLQRDGDPRYARLCNLITGEEQKIVDENAPLTSCTVEMASTSRTFDVAVIDEIQMIADRDRGSAWASAVLGLNARELHLCGEETAVPLVEAILRDTGDKLIVNRYERLSPLEVAPSSLEGNLKLVQKGDCIVTFSRKNIFDIKNKIEKMTNLRCAVAYGRLPPEIRSEQASLFNKPGSGYDILVASDAIGMGLNLKIKRVIFQAVSKFDGGKLRQLSTSQIKQIAGRAGRYGLHGTDSSAGVVTTLFGPDLPVVRKALLRPMQPLKFARLSNGAQDSFRHIVNALPRDSAARTIIQVYQFVAKMHPIYEFVDFAAMRAKLDFVDEVAGDLTIADRSLLLQAPTPWSDEVALQACGRMMVLYRTEMRVSLKRALKDSGLWDSFNDILRMSETSSEPEHFGNALQMLESLHKTIVMYLWLSYRKMVGFPDQTEAFEVKAQAERAMEWCLERLTAARLQQSEERQQGKKIWPKKEPQVEKPGRPPKGQSDVTSGEGRSSRGWVQPAALQ